MNQELKSSVMLFLAAFIWFGTETVAAESILIRLVQIGFHGRTSDACASVGMVSADPEIKVSVWADPSTPPFRIAEIESGKMVFLCDDTFEDWIGIVYPKSEGTDCGVSSPAPAVTYYSGPCAMGWVKIKQVKLVAG